MQYVDLRELYEFIVNELFSALLVFVCNLSLGKNRRSALQVNVER